MTTGHYLLDNPNPHGPHYYTTRREPVLAIVVHITAGLEDLDTRDDHSAERTAAYAASTERAVSWHLGCDSDSFLSLLPTSYTAFHCQGYNSCTCGLEISKAETVWADEPDDWIDATLTNAADALRPVAQRHKVPHRRATRAELDAARAHWRATGEARPVGFIAHADLDPGRRSDPGADFPWTRFFALLEDDDMALTDEDRKLLREIRDNVAAARRDMENYYKLTMFGRPDPQGPDTSHVGLKELRDQIAAIGSGGGGTGDDDALAHRVAAEFAARLGNARTEPVH